MNSKKSRPLLLRPYFLTLYAAVILIAVLSVLVTTDKITWFDKKSPQAENVKKSQNTARTGIPDKGTNTDKTETSTPASSATLLAPTGTFISNHRPNLSGTPAPHTEESVCNTTPGAQCVIQLSLNGVMKTLGAKTADPSGSAYWTWSVKDEGLTSGSWEVTATATLNGKSLSTKDGLNLVVSP